MRYLLFAWRQYCSVGGWDDLLAISDEIEKLQLCAESLEAENRSPDLWAHIVDIETKEIVVRGACLMNHETKEVKWEWDKIT